MKYSRVARECRQNRGTRGTLWISRLWMRFKNRARSRFIASEFSGLIKRDYAKLNSHLVYNMHLRLKLMFDDTNITIDEFAWIFCVNVFFLQISTSVRNNFIRDHNVIHDFCDGINIIIKLKLKRWNKFSNVELKLRDITEWLYIYKRSIWNT